MESVGWGLERVSMSRVSRRGMDNSSAPNIGTIEAETTATTRSDHLEPAGAREVAQHAQPNMEVAGLMATVVQDVAHVDVESSVVIVSDHCVALSVITTYHC